MRRDKKSPLGKGLKRSRGRKPRAVVSATIPTFTVIAPPLTAFEGGRTQAVRVAFPSGLPIDNGTVTLEAEGDSIVPMLFDEPKWYRAFGHYPQWTRYVESYRRVGTELLLYDDHDTHVATIQVAQPDLMNLRMTVSAGVDSAQGNPDVVRRGRRVTPTRCANRA